jgi:O-succinylbenzoic acid--CoA ligase
VPGPGESLETAIPRLGATHVSLVPAQLRRLLDSTEGTAALKRLKAVLLGGSALPLPLLEEAAARGLPVCTTYGLTEMASQVATTRWGDTQAPLAQAAPVLSPGSVSLGEDGAIHVRGACRFAGYWRDGALDTPFDAGGWFDTGDLGAWDAEGRLRIVGRRDNRFISGGENIHPEEVERILTALPEVEDAVVAPVPSRTWGYRPMAVVRWRTGVAPLGIDALRTRLAVHLPAYKLPDAAFAWPEALDTPGIKAPRHAVAAWLRRTIGVDPAPKTTEDGQPPTESNGASS